MRIRPSEQVKITDYYRQNKLDIASNFCLGESIQIVFFNQKTLRLLAPRQISQ